METIKITRSFAAKVNLGNYENIDVYCAAEMEVPADESLEWSAHLNKFCIGEVRNEVDAIKRRKGGGQ
jgi:hypothetical protein